MSPLEAANNVIRNAIEAANGPLPPSFVVEFLLTHWRQYLAAIHRVHGETSQEWKDAIAVSDQLVWSVAPKATEQERMELGRCLERLVAAIKEGMIVAGCDRDARVQFLRRLSECHLQLVSPPKSEGDAATATAEIDLNQTVQLRPEDLRRRELLDMLDHAYVQHIEVEAR